MNASILEQKIAEINQKNISVFFLQILVLSEKIQNDLNKLHYLQQLEEAQIASIVPDVKTQSYNKDKFVKMLKNAGVFSFEPKNEQ